MRERVNHEDSGCWCQKLSVNDDYEVFCSIRKTTYQYVNIIDTESIINHCCYT